MKNLSRVYIALCFIILYAPIAVLMLFSFNSTSSTGVFSGFSQDAIDFLSEIRVNNNQQF